ncbi:uncharacterized protein LOC125239793 [Leguminivora glycinivorella]|uniref:uncharacterized protein LOC125239793 n=1 Tax=Leguminivora glycinivorella TaxID=1035111 RepID=UPI0020101537|nr:uncharacterized protein LOC125239793 [Leguminivora glycinivorella]
MAPTYITNRCIVETQLRGPMLKVVLSVMRFEDDANEIVTNNYINGMALVVVSMRPLKTPEFHLQVNVKIKKTIQAKKKTVSLNVTAEGFNKEILCQDDWLEFQIPTKKYDGFLSKKSNIFLYTITINFVIQDATHSVVCNEHYKELYEETEFTDFKLQAEDGTVPVHKSVLFVHSEMFRAMLKGQWKETGQGSIDMVGVTVKTLQCLKAYMYLGTIPNTELELKPLLLLARRCLMDKLAAGCIEKLIATAKLDTLDGLIEYAVQNNIPELIKGIVLRTPDNALGKISMVTFI